MTKKTLSQIRSEAGRKGGLKSARTRKVQAMRDPLTTVSIRKSTKAELDKLAACRGQKITNTLHDIITNAQVERKATQVERK